MAVEFKAEQTGTNGLTQFIVTKTSGDAVVHNVVLRLDAGEARALVRAAVRALAYTRVDRAPRAWWTTTERDVERVIAPILQLVGAIFPKPGMTKAQLIQLAQENMPIGEFHG